MEQGCCAAEDKVGVIENGVCLLKKLSDFVSEILKLFFLKLR